MTAPHNCPHCRRGCHALMLEPGSGEMVCLDCYLKSEHDSVIDKLHNIMRLQMGDKNE